MKQSIKRCLAMVLSLALTLTMIPSQAASMVYAEGTSGTTRTVFDTMVEDFTVDNLPSVITEDGNLTLPRTVAGQTGTTVTWSSSNPAVIKIVTPDDATKPYTGEVTRSDVTSQVKLTATIKQDTQTGTKDFDVVVRMKTPISDSAIAAYDFADFAVKTGSSDILTDAAARELTLEGTGTKPKLVTDDKRGQVLSLTQQTYANRADALLPENPFENQSVENGLTLNFWTKSTGATGGANCLVDFEVAPATDPAATADPDRAGTIAVSQQMIYYNTTSQSGPFTDFAIGDHFTKDVWKMFTLTITKDGITTYVDGKETKHSVSSGSENYEQMIKDITGTGGLLGDGDTTKVRLGASLATYWNCAGALLDDVSFYNTALPDEDVAALYNETLAADIPLESVTVTGPKSVVEGKDIQLGIELSTGATTKKITWAVASKDDGALAVDSTGKVTGKKIGTGYVTATVAGITSEPYKIDVVSNEQDIFNQMLEVFDLRTKVRFGNFNLPNTIDDNGKTSIAWESKNTSVIAIDASGDVIKAIVTPDDGNSVDVKLEASVTYENKETNAKFSGKKEFTITILGYEVKDRAIAYYDFADYTKKDENTLTNSGKPNEDLKLESVGDKAKKPELKNDDLRGQVLSLTEQNYADRGFALLPKNPFEGKSVDEGFTVNFWTNTTGTSANGRCLLDFEVAPAEDPAATADPDRAGTLAMNQQMIYWNTTSQNGNFTDYDIGSNFDKGIWKMFTMAVTKDGISFYVNGKKINHSISAGSANYEQMIKDLAGQNEKLGTGKTNVRIGASLATYWSCAGALIDDISFYGTELSAAEVAKLYTETRVNVSLTGIAINGSHKIDEGDVSQLRTDLTPTNATIDEEDVIWKSSNPSVVKVSEDGQITGLKAGKSNITVTYDRFTSQSFEVEVVANITSLESGKKYLTVYSTTKDFYASAANLEQETQSVYMAVSEDGQNFNVLNNGGGVIFSKNTKGTLCITKPKVYVDNSADAAAPFTVEAQDADSTKGIHVFTSQDGVNYYDDTLEESTDNFDPALKKSNFELLLNGSNILESDESITLGNAVELTDAQYKKIVDKLGTVKNTGLDALDELKITSAQSAEVTEGLLNEMYPSVDAKYSDDSSQNFKIDWTDALNDVDLSKEGTYSLTGKVVQPKYLNNLKELNGSELPDDDPTNVDEKFPDNYDPATKTVYYDKTKFIEGMADPYIYWDETSGYYYMTASYFPENGDKIDNSDRLQQYDRVVMRRGKTLEELQTRSNQVTIWKVKNQTFEDKDGTQKEGYRYIWAPEIHRIGDKWVVYFTESHSSDAFNIYSHALVLDGDLDPYETALKASNEASQWKDYKMRADSTVEKDPFDTAFCLDMTYFKAGGKSYVVWAGKPTVAYKGGNTDLFIATVDENEPWKITSEATRVTYSDYGWERVRFCVNEGPTVLQHDGKIFLCYSASGTGSEYAIGMCMADASEDLLDVSKWTKSPYPLLTSRDVNGEEGPGHNSFTVDKDGNVIFVYHARPTSHNYQQCGNYNAEALNDPCRHARLKRVHWAADGTPILKMTYEDELLDDYKEVTLKVTVGEGGTELKKPVTGITLSKTSLQMAKDTEETLTAKIEPEDATNKTLTWESSDPSVVRIAETDVGVTLTARKDGKATITATAVSGVTASCEVTVIIPVTSISLNKPSLSLTVGGSDTLVATVNPDNATDKTVTWATSNPQVATVDGGKVTAVGAGNATITATAGGKSAPCTVNVTAAGGSNQDPTTDPVPVQKVTKVTLNKTKLTLGIKDKFTLKATPDLASAVQSVSWSVDTKGKKYVTLNTKTGKVTGKKKGTAKVTVTVTSKDGSKITKTCKITVKPAPTKKTKISVKKSITVKVKKSTTLKPKVKGNFGCSTFKFTSKSKKIAKVDASGKVTGVKKGKTTITVSTYNKKAKATVKVTVK